MMNKTITQVRKERDQAAIRAARYRKERSARPDVRAVDKALSEALVVYSRSLAPADAKALLKRVHELAVVGLEIKGYGPKSSRTRTALRLQTWSSPTPHSGSVRYAQDRIAVSAKRDAITL